MFTDTFFDFNFNFDVKIRFNVYTYSIYTYVWDLFLIKNQFILNRNDNGAKVDYRKIREQAIKILDKHWKDNNFEEEQS